MRGGDQSAMSIEYTKRGRQEDEFGSDIDDSDNESQPPPAASSSHQLADEPEPKQQRLGTPSRSNLERGRLLIVVAEEENLA